MHRKNFEKSILLSNRRNCFCLHYNGAFRYLFEVEIYKFKANKSEINLSLLFWGDVSKDLSADNMKKTGLHGYVHDFLVDYGSIDVSDCLDIHRYMIKKHDIK